MYVLHYTHVYVHVSVYHADKLKGQSILPQITIVLCTFIWNADKFFCDSKRVQSSKKGVQNSQNDVLCTPPPLRQMLSPKFHFSEQY